MLLSCLRRTSTKYSTPMHCKNRLVCWILRPSVIRVIIWYFCTCWLSVSLQKKVTCISCFQKWQAVITAISRSVIILFWLVIWPGRLKKSQKTTESHKHLKKESSQAVPNQRVASVVDQIIYTHNHKQQLKTENTSGIVHLL